MITLGTPTPFQRLIRDRRSIRSFLDKPVEREKILSCIEAARWAPSAENVQPWRFIVIDDPQLREEFGKAAFSGIYYPSRFAAKAPLLIVVLAKKDLLANVIGKQIQGTSWYLIDIGITGEHIVLQAQELGLGTCWVGWFNAKKVRTFLHIPPRYKVVILIAMGYYSEKPARVKQRKPLEEIVSFNGFKKGSED
ncbi:MAG: nitroreductase family protein [Gemmatimonadota bacterium]|nr:MAG: nitroreductase family protein [Gemmatimonadota bacterium]